MKKLFVCAICLFIVNSLFAQFNNDSIDSSYADSEEQNVQTQKEISGITDLTEVVNLLKQIQNTSFNKSASDISYPLIGNSKFSRHHHICQAVEISTVMGESGDNGESDDYKDKNDLKSLGGGTDFGFNIGWSIFFVPGTPKNNKLIPNRFGFAYSLGAQAQFYSQKEYDVTCDLLLKFGVETGFGKQIGFGIDFLAGSGKTEGCFYVGKYVPDEDDADPDDIQYGENEVEGYDYTDWCFKYGFQLWTKVNILQKQVSNNLDFLLFAKFVNSVDPNRNVNFISEGIYNIWHDERWGFGLKIRYLF